MGTWDVGPFDNETAADFCASLDEAAEGDRPGLVRDALARVLDAEDPLDRHLAVAAVAGAALVAAQCPGGRPVTGPEGPDLPVPVLPADLRGLAVRALDRVEAEPSELRRLWAETDTYPHWLWSLHLLRRVLTFPAPQPVARSWARIDSWMRRHAPASYALLAPPADPAEVEAAQETMGIRFPADLLESLSCHNGIAEWARLLPDEPPMSVAGILGHWQMCVEFAEDDPDFAEPDDGQEPWWHPQWIPWAQSHGDSQVIDMREGPGQGRLGNAAHDDVGCFDAGWPSLAVYLTAVADALDQGREVEGKVPYLTPDGGLWWAVPHQTALNGAPLTPAPRAEP
ncbi:DUF4259 domain-containing protein [Streptomyces sp. BR123]|uniref:DUF4259 domain-containing protein n=1 Tax=Streptomyces sp. BR123 TaxID=2749828 RepID=UPI0027BA9C64|nr:DUF4259 domain-containing protein [Streptomyces sp. BR123]